MRAVHQKNFEVPPWPCITKLKPNELFSSWLVRLAHSHLQKLQTFYHVVLRGVQIWNRDIDRLATDKMQEFISAKTLTDLPKVKLSTLPGYDSYLFEKCISTTNTPWIIPLTITHRIRKSCGLMYCPKCLKADKQEPYYRKNWRLSLSVVCPEHKCFLVDKCPNCKSPVNFHRIELGRKNQSHIFPISHCYKCLKCFANLPIKRAPNNLIEMQSYLNAILKNGYVEELNIQYSSSYFDVLRNLVKIFNSPEKRSVKLNRVVCRELKIRFVMPKGGVANNFDVQGIFKRAVLLYKAFWLLGDWPRRFIETTHKAKMWSSYLLKDFNNPPYWYYKVVKENNQILFSEWKNQISKTYPKHSSYNHVAASMMKRKGF